MWAVPFLPYFPFFVFACVFFYFQLTQKIKKKVVNKQNFLSIPDHFLFLNFSIVSDAITGRKLMPQIISLYLLFYLP